MELHAYQGLGAYVCSQVYSRCTAPLKWTLLGVQDGSVEKSCCFNKKKQKTKNRLHPSEVLDKNTAEGSVIESNMSGVTDKIRENP